MLDKDHLKAYVEEVLNFLEPEIQSGQFHVDLIMLTIATESLLGEYAQQVRGPAKGIVQMEPFTETDIWNNYLKYRQPLAKKVQQLKDKQDLDPLRFNLRYQIAMARVLYDRKKLVAPVAGEPSTNVSYDLYLAQMWKKHYNTHLGKGTVEKAVQHYNDLVLKG